MYSCILFVILIFHVFVTAPWYFRKYPNVLLNTVWGSIYCFHVFPSIPPRKAMRWLDTHGQTPQFEEGLPLSQAWRRAADRTWRPHGLSANACDVLSETTRKKTWNTSIHWWWISFFPIIWWHFPPLFDGISPFDLMVIDWEKLWCSWYKTQVKKPSHQRWDSDDQDELGRDLIDQPVGFILVWPASMYNRCIYNYVQLYIYICFYVHDHYHKICISIYMYMYICKFTIMYCILHIIDLSAMYHNFTMHCPWIYISC